MFPPLFSICPAAGCHHLHHPTHPHPGQIQAHKQAADQITLNSVGSWHQLHHGHHQHHHHHVPPPPPPIHGKQSLVVSGERGGGGGVATSNQRLMPNSSTDLTAPGNKRRGTVAGAAAAEHHHRKKSRMISGMRRYEKIMTARLSELCFPALVYRTR